MRPSVLRRAESPTRSSGGQAPESDAELMGAIAAGDLAALGALYDRYHEAVRQFVRRATASGPDADDIVHDVFLSLPQAAATYDGRPSARPFLIGIAAQRVRRRARSFARLPRLLALFAETIPRWVQRTPEDTAVEAEELRLFNDALMRLSDDKRIVLLMVEREGLSGEEVASALHIPVATVWTRLHYARAALRSALAERRAR